MHTTPGQWDLDACDGSGVKLTSLTRHQGTSFTYTRNGVPEAQLSLSHDDAECATILTALAKGAGGGVPTLKAHRTGRGGTKVLRFNGYLAATSEESGADASTATFTFRGPFGRLLGDGANAGRFYFQGSPLVYTATDAGAIAEDLRRRAMNPMGQMNLGDAQYVRAGVVQPTKVRDRTYLRGQNYGEAIVNLSNVLDGFDFECVPVDEGLTQAAFNVYSQQGADRPGVKFEYGSGTQANCSAVGRQTLSPVNVVFVAGAGTGTTPAQAIHVSSAQQYGVYQLFVTANDVADSQTLLDKANALIRPKPVKTISFMPDPRLAPLPWDDYWIGDAVQFYARRGALVEGPLSVRVNQIRVVIDPDTGLEAAEIPDPVTGDEERTIRANLKTEVVV